MVYNVYGIIVISWYISTLKMVLRKQQTSLSWANFLDLKPHFGAPQSGCTRCRGTVLWGSWIQLLWSVWVIFRPKIWTLKESKRIQDILMWWFPVINEALQSSFWVHRPVWAIQSDGFSTVDMISLGFWCGPQGISTRDFYRIFMDFYGIYIHIYIYYVLLLLRSLSMFFLVQPCRATSHIFPSSPAHGVFYGFCKLPCQWGPWGVGISIHSIHGGSPEWLV